MTTTAAAAAAATTTICEMHACDVPVPAHGGLASEHVERRCNDCKDCKS